MRPVKYFGSVWEPNISTPHNFTALSLLGKITDVLYGQLFKPDLDLKSEFQKLHFSNFSNFFDVPDSASSPVWSIPTVEHDIDG